MDKTKLIFKLAVIAFLTILTTSCDNSLESRVDELEEQLADQQETIDSLMVVLQDQNSQINALLFENQQLLDSLTALYDDKLDSVIAVQQEYIDSLYAYQQDLIESFMSTVASSNSGFTDVEVFSGSCPSDWEDLDLTEATGAKKSLVILKVTSLDSTSNDANPMIVFRPNGETDEWLGTSSIGGIATMTSLSIVYLGYSDSGLGMVYTDDAGLIELKRNPSKSLNAKISVVFYLNYN